MATRFPFGPYENAQPRSVEVSTERVESLHTESGHFTEFVESGADKNSTPTDHAECHWRGHLLGMRDRQVKVGFTGEPSSERYALPCQMILDTTVKK